MGKTKKEKENALETVARFRTVRRKMGLSQSQAAKKWKLTLSSLQDWEQRKHVPSRASVMYLQQIIDNFKREAEEKPKRDWPKKRRKKQA